MTPPEPPAQPPEPQPPEPPAQPPEPSALPPAPSFAFYPPPGWQPQDPRRIRGARVAGGILIAIVAHLFTIGVGIVSALRGSDLWIYAILVGQLAVFVACITIGIVQIVRGDRGVGIGLLVGWAVGVLVLPVIGFGVCVALLSEQIGAQ